MGLTGATLHRGRNQYGGMKADDVKEVEEFERETIRLEQIVKARPST